MKNLERIHHNGHISRNLKQHITLMNKKIIQITILVWFQAFLACTNADEVQYVSWDAPNASTPDGYEDISVCYSSDSVSILNFESHEAYQQALRELYNLGSDDERMQWMHDSYPGFVSIRDLYEKAGADAAEADLWTVEQYDSFRSEYSSLYFPLLEEDAGFYIPIKDETTSYLANRDCRVVIGGEEIDLKDIHGYQDLQETGRAYYSVPEAIPMATEVPFEITGPSMNSVGPEYDSGWTEYGKLKVKLKARRILKKYEVSYGFYGGQSLFHTEFCFRKKVSVLGWINFKSESSLTGKVTIPRFTIMNLNSSKKGTSSHDEDYQYPIYISTENGFRYYRYYEAPCEATVIFEGMTLNYSWSMPGIVCKRATSYATFPIIPSNLNDQ